MKLNSITVKMEAGSCGETSGQTQNTTQNTLLRIILMFWVYEIKFHHREDGGSKLWRNVWTNPKHYAERRNLRHHLSKSCF